MNDFKKEILDDGEKREREQLAAERAKLNAAQLIRLDNCADQLRESDIYAVRHEKAIAHIILTERPHQQRTEIAIVFRRAEDEAETQRIRDQATAKKQASKEAEEKNERPQKLGAEPAGKQQLHGSAKEFGAEQPTQNYERRNAELEKKTLAAQREPVPGTMDRFNALLSARKAEKKAQTRVNASGLIVRPAQYNATVTRQPDVRTTIEPSRMAENPLMHKSLEKGAQRGEISDAKADRAEKFQRMFDSNESRDKDFDATHDTDNIRNFSNGRDGRGGRSD